MRRTVCCKAAILLGFDLEWEKGFEPSTPSLAIMHRLSVHVPSCPLSMVLLWRSVRGRLSAFTVILLRLLSTLLATQGSLNTVGASQPGAASGLGMGIAIPTTVRLTAAS